MVVKLLQSAIRNFNSIKVRLERRFYEISSLHGSFQFHKGTIRTALQTYLSALVLNFNSIKVRLEHQYFDIYEILNNKFQFHKGTIRTGLPVMTLIRPLYFNSIKVRLELRKELINGSLI